MTNSKKAPPTKVELARAELEKARKSYNVPAEDRKKLSPHQRSILAARYTSAQLALDAEVAKEAADAVRKKAEQAAKDVESLEKAG